MTLEEALTSYSVTLVLVDMAGQHFRTAQGRWRLWSEIEASDPLSDFKFFHADWVMIDWPSGVGELSPGWIHLAAKQRSSLAKRERRKVDAGKPSVVDAGKPVVCSL